jgi:ribosomal protein S18 acetylase RimI-like enzyme
VSGAGVTPAITIRLYSKSDLDAVIAILRDLFASELTIYDRTRPPQEIGADYVENLRVEAEKSRGVMLVAEVDGEVVGYCTLHIHRDTAGDTDEIYYEYAHLGDLGVRAQFRSMGVGKKLITHCEGLARDAGKKWLRLNVLATNKRARKFYAEHGFAENLVNLEKPL